MKGRGGRGSAFYMCRGSKRWSTFALIRKRGRGGGTRSQTKKREKRGGKKKKNDPSLLSGGKEGKRELSYHSTEAGGIKTVWRDKRKIELPKGEGKSLS